MTSWAWTGGIALVAIMALLIHLSIVFGNSYKTVRNAFLTGAMYIGLILLNFASEVCSDAGKDVIAGMISNAYIAFVVIVIAMTFYTVIHFLISVIHMLLEYKREKKFGGDLDFTK